MRHFEVFKPLSIISFSFVAIKKDISFRIIYFGGFDNYEAPTDQAEMLRGGITLLNFDKIECEFNPFRGNLLVLKPGIYQAEFSN